MLRSVLSVVIGVLLGSALILVVEMLGHEVFSPLPGANPGGAMAIVAAAWFAGALGGGVAASLIAKRWAPAAWVVAATILLLAGATIAELPHPLWMIAGAIVSTAFGGYLSVRLTSGYYGQPASGGPKSIL